MTYLLIHSVCIAFATVLFITVNFVGKYAVTFGYSSTTLFDDPSEALSLNLLVKILPPSILMVLLSAVAVSTGNEDLRLQSYWISVYYYLIRALYFPISNIHRLVNWRRFCFHATLGMAAAWIAQQYLIIPKEPLLPDLESSGNEIWLAIFVFLYSVGNNITITDTRFYRRRNSFIRHSYENAAREYGCKIDFKTTDDLLKLTAYSVIVYEGYCRPPVIRFLERLWFWKDGRTTGVMQVSFNRPLSDLESVEKGIEELSRFWAESKENQSWDKVRDVIGGYNRDNDYINNVTSVMEIIAKQIDRKFCIAYERMWERSYSRSHSSSNSRKADARKARRNRNLLRVAHGNAR